MNQQTCDVTRLNQFLGGSLNCHHEQLLTSHLDECTSCRQRLDDLAADHQSWSEAKELLCDSLDSATFNQSGCSDDSFEIEQVLAQLGPTDEPDSLGRVGGYEVTGVVGSGGMGVVLKAHDRSLDRVVAVKVMAPHLAASGSARQRFAREAKAAAAVLHPNVIAIHGVSNEQSLPYLVMPYVRGNSLQKRIDTEGPLPVVDTLRIGSQVAAGLAAAHEQGLVHRDIKPANILLESGVERVAITDFGLARAADDASMTRSGVISGTPQYMSPEQARGEVIDARSDLFSLGSLLYAMCTGHSPFRAETSYGVLHRIINDSPRSIRELNPDIPDWLENIIMKLLSKSPEDRFDTAEEVADSLEDCLAHAQRPTSSPLPESARTASPRRGSRPPWRRLFAAAAFGFSAIFAGVLIVLELNKGTLTIESDSDDVPIRIMQGDEVVRNLTVSRSGNSIRVAAGNYVVQLDGDFPEMQIENETVSLKRRDTETIRIRHTGSSVQPDQENVSGGKSRDTGQKLSDSTDLPVYSSRSDGDLSRTNSFAPSKLPIARVTTEDQLQGFWRFVSHRRAGSTSHQPLYESDSWLKYGKWMEIDKGRLVMHSPPFRYHDKYHYFDSRSELRLLHNEKRGTVGINHFLAGIQGGNLLLAHKVPVTRVGTPKSFDDPEIAVLTYERVPAISGYSKLSQSTASAGIREAVNAEKPRENPQDSPANWLSDLQGNWTVNMQHVADDGKQIEETSEAFIRGNRIELSDADGTDSQMCDFVIGAAGPPQQIDLKPVLSDLDRLEMLGEDADGIDDDNGNPIPEAWLNPMFKGIAEKRQDGFRYCGGVSPVDPRPIRFASGKKWVLWTFKRPDTADAREGLDRRGRSEPIPIPGSYAAQLPDGRSIELVGITPNNEPASDGWSPDGRPLGDIGVEWDPDVVLGGNSRDFLFRFDGLKTVPSVRFSLPGHGAHFTFMQAEELPGPWRLRVGGSPAAGVSIPGQFLRQEAGIVQVAFTDEPWGDWVRVSAADGSILNPDDTTAGDDASHDEFHIRGVVDLPEEPNTNATGGGRTQRNPLPASPGLTMFQTRRHSQMNDFRIRGIDSEGEEVQLMTGRVTGRSGKDRRFPEERTWRLYKPLPDGRTLSHFEFRLRPFRYLVTFENVATDAPTDKLSKVKVIVEPIGGG